MVREGARALPGYQFNERSSLQVQAVASQYVASYVVIHSEKSPADKIFYLEKQSIPEVYKSYQAHFQNHFCVKPSTFRKLWYKGLKTPVADPASGELYAVQRRKRRAVGFKKCDVCSELEFGVMMAKNKNDRLLAKNRLRAHLQKVLNHPLAHSPLTHGLTHSFTPGESKSHRVASGTGRLQWFHHRWLLHRCSRYRQIYDTCDKKHRKNTRGDAPHQKQAHWGRIFQRKQKVAAFSHPPKHYNRRQSHAHHFDQANTMTY